MIVKEKIYIERDINYRINGDFYLDGVTGTKGRVRASDPGFVFNATISGNVAKVEYEYKLPISTPKTLVGEFVVITDKEDIKIPYEFNLFNNVEKIPENIRIEDITPSIFVSQQFGERYPENSKERILWEAYKTFTVNEKNIEEFFIAIGKLKRTDKNIKEISKKIIVNNDAKNLYLGIQRCIFNFFSGIDSETIFLSELKKYINKLKNLSEPEYKTKTLEYLLAYVSNDVTKCEYIFETLDKCMDHEDKMYEAIYYYIRAIYYNTEESFLESINKLDTLSYELNMGFVYWLLYLLKKRFDKTINELYVWLKKIVSLGNNSPFIYMEINKIIEEFDTAVLKADYIEVRVLYWGYRKKLLSKKIIDYIINRTNYMSGYHSQLFNILKNEYYKNNDIQILQVICALLIHGNRTDEIAFHWYKKGIENKIRITSLIEYFLNSLPTCYDEILPSEVYVYFKDNKMLSRKNKQSLYYNIIKNRENILHIYEYYKGDMNEYALRSLRERRVSDELVCLYNEFPPGIIMDKVLSHCILNIYCAFRFRCLNNDIKKLIILQSRLSNLIEIWPIEGIADARIPDSNFLILAEMKDDSVILADESMVEYKRMMNYNPDVEYAFELGKTHIVALMENKKPTIETLIEINKKNLLRNYYKKEIQSNLIKYYLINNELVNHITELDIDFIDNKKELINEYIEAGEFSIALKCIVDKGFNIADTDMKLNILKGMVFQNYQATDILRDLALDIYRSGVKDEEVIMFLYEQNELTLNEELENYELLKFNLIDDVEFYEKSESYCKYLIEQNKNFANSNLYTYLLEKKEELSTVKLLELLRWLACKDNYNSDIKEFISEKLEKIVEIGLYPEWIMKYKAKGMLPTELADKVILSLKIPGYIIYKYKFSKGSMLKEVKLNRITDNLYVAAISMFYGDEIEFKLLDEDRNEVGEIYNYKNDKIIKSQNYKDGFDKLNDIIYAKKNNSKELNKLIGEYKGMKDMALSLFKPRV